MPFRADAWIDQFQQDISFPVAARVAMFARVPLIGSAELGRLHEPKVNLMTVALGPFHVVHDTKYSFWQPFWVSVIEAGAAFGNVVASSLCLIDGRTGRGGFRYVRVWDMYTQRWVYWGDHERDIRWQGVVRIVTDHLASQYHVGFVEDAQAKMKDPIKQLESTRAVWGDDNERQRQLTLEREVEQQKRVIL